MDVVFIRELKVQAIIGVHAWERQLPQQLVVDVELSTDVPRAAASDAVADAIDYEQVALRLTACIVEGRFQLIETLAERCVALLLAEFPTRHVCFTVTKPGALAASRSVGIRIERSRD